MKSEIHAFKAEAQALGLTVLAHRHTSHHVLRLACASRPGAGTRSITLGASSSDHRAAKNNLARLRRIAKELLQ